MKVAVMQNSDTVKHQTDSPERHHLEQFILTKRLPKLASPCRDGSGENNFVVKEYTMI